MSLCIKPTQLYDPINNKCYGVKSKKGQDLLRLIKVCSQYKDIDPECKEINKVYLTRAIKFKRVLKKSMIPIISIILFNLLVFLLLSSPRIRNKLVEFSIKKMYLNNNPALIPLLEFIPIISKFVENYSGLARSLIFGASVSDILGILNNFVKGTPNNQILFTDKEFNQNVNRLAREFEKSSPKIMPGAWPESRVSPELQKKVRVTEKRVDTIINHGDTSKMFSLFSNWL